VVRMALNLAYNYGAGWFPGWLGRFCYAILVPTLPYNFALLLH